MINQTISHYKILKKLGEGGMGEVYLAEDTKLDRKVALKFLPPQYTSDAELNKRFRREAKATAALNHPNIITVYEIGEHEGRAYIAMEYVQGESLRVKVTSGPLAVDSAVDIALQICEGLNAAHQAGIIHRDIKPENIIVDKSGRVRVLDFGLARMTGATKLTKEATTLGTISYKAPEQFRGQPVDQRADIWAVGIVLYEMLAGELPFDGEFEEEVMYKVLNDEPVPVSSLRSDVPQKLAAAIHKALAKKANQRYQSAEEMLADLKSIAAGESSARPQTRAVDSGARANSRSSLLYGGIATLLVLAAIVWFVTRKHATEPATQAAADRSSIAVMYFENRSSEQDLDKILVDMLTTNLARHDGLEVVSSQRLFDILKNMGKQDVSTIDKTVATEVANQAKVKTMLLGSIIQIGNRLRITSQLTNVETGDIITSEQAEGEKIEDIFGMVDELTEKISGKLMVVDSEPANQPLRIADATTANYRAYQFYQRGLEYEWRWDFRNAATNFERAVEIDSTFAMAHLKIAQMRYIFDPTNHYADLTPARKRMALAEKYSEKANPKDQLLIAAFKAMFNRRLDQSISLFSDFVKRYPDEKDAWFYLAWFHRISNNSEQGLADIQKAIALDPTYANGQNFSAYTLSLFGRHSEAIAAIKRYIALQPDVRNVYDSGWEIYMIAGELDSALAVCERALRVNSNWRWFQRHAGYVYLFQGDGENARARLLLGTDRNPEETPSILRNMAYFYLYEGRNTAALKELQRAVAAARAANNSFGLQYALIHSGKALMVLKRFDEALRAFEQAREISKSLYPTRVTPIDIITAYWSGVIHLRKEDERNAQAQADQIRAMVEENKLDQLFLDYAYLLQAEIQLEKGDAAAAQKFIEQVSPFSVYSPRLAEMKARVLSHAGQTEEAIDALKKAKDNVVSRSLSQSGGDEFDYLYLRSRAHYLLGRFYERSGDARQAIAYYAKAIQQWKDADAGHEELADAKARLSKLEGVELQ